MASQLSSLADSSESDSAGGAAPERTLVAAVLERAVRDVLDGDEEAVDWFADDDESENAPFSFIWICEQLELDPEKVRASVFGKQSTWAKRKQKAAEN
jgi:hypothetical protein